MAVAAAHAEVQALLRFLTQDAKLSLSDALPHIVLLRKQALNNAEAIAKAGLDVVQTIFTDEKVAKQVVNAAKRTMSSKKRSAAHLDASNIKRAKTDEHPDQSDELRLALPRVDLSADELEGVELVTNRAPLVLAFAVTVLKYSMPSQPVSSRLSLAQALVSANSQSRAQALGLSSGTSAEDDGWAQGQPHVTVLGRQVAVLRRHQPTPAMTGDSQETLTPEMAQDTFWGLDLEALRKSNGPLVAGKRPEAAGLPIHTPDGARAYLMKSFSIYSPADNGAATEPRKTPKLKPGEVSAKKAEALSMLLRAIDLLCMSWQLVLAPEELDKRAWSWYVQVRPDVAGGRAGWGQKGTVALHEILKLRREADC